MSFTDSKAAMLADAYRRTRGHVAFLDESYQAPDAVGQHRQTFYLFTAVIVAQDDMEPLREELGDIAGSSYWHTTDALQTDGGRQAAAEMLEYLADGPETCIIAHQITVNSGDHDAEEARRTCYRGLAAELTAGRDGGWAPVELLVLEERNQGNLCNKDTRNHKELLREGLVPRSTRLLQASPSVERLLWLPDLVSAAFRRTITHNDETAELFEIVRPRSHVLEISGQNPSRPHK